MTEHQQPPAPSWSYPEHQTGGSGLPAAPSAPPGPPPPPVRKDRRGLRAALRWGVAVLLCAAAAGGTGYAATRADRGDLPGLKTESDGRWDYPALKLPALPAGRPKPFADANTGLVHYVDVRELLLPAPAGATADDALPGPDGWLPEAAYAGQYEKGVRDDIRQQLRDDAVRHIAATGWSMPDGTKTRIYLLQFNTGASASDFYDAELSGGLEPRSALTGAPNAAVDESWKNTDHLRDVELYVYDEAKPRGSAHVRQAYIVAGDTVGLVVQEKAGTAAKVPFQQTLVLQHQLLG